MKERALAILGAVALVALALVARGALADDDSSGPGGGRSGGTGDLLVVACTPDLGSVCDALAASGAIAEITPFLDLANAADPPGEVDAWITWDPAPAIANFDADKQGTPPPWGDPVAVASAPLALLLPPGKVEALQAACAAVNWACLVGGEAPDLGVGRPGTAEGLSRLAPLAVALDTAGDGTVDARLKDVVAGPQGGQFGAVTMADRLLIQGVGAVGAVVGPRAALETAQAKPAGLPYVVVEPAPTAEATVVAVPVSGTSLGTLSQALAQQPVVEALSRRGVVAPGGTLADSQRAGFLYQVRKKVG